MSYLAKNGNYYSHKESPEEYERRHLYSGLEPEPKFPKLRYILSFISALFILISFFLV
jgi:hypothetical protein